MGVAAIPLALSAVGAGLSYYNTRQTASKQDDALAAQIRQQQANQRQADARTQAMIQQQGQATDTKEKAQGLASFQNVLKTNAAQAQQSLFAPGAVSQAYQQSGANAAQGISNYGNQQADLMSSINAPGQQRQNNVKNLDDYQSDMNLLRRKAQGDDYLAAIYQRGIRRNPWMDLASGLLGGAAHAYSPATGVSDSYNQYDYMKNYGDPNSPGSFDYLDALMNSRSYGSDPYGYLKNGG